MQWELDLPQTQKRSFNIANVYKAEQLLVEQLQCAAPDGVAAPQPAAPAQTPGMPAAIDAAEAAIDMMAAEAVARSLDITAEAAIDMIAAEAAITDPTVAAATVDSRAPQTPDGQRPKPEPQSLRSFQSLSPPNRNATS